MVVVRLCMGFTRGLGGVGPPGKFSGYSYGAVTTVMIGLDLKLVRMGQYIIYNSASVECLYSL